MKDFCVRDIPMEGVTLDDLGATFAEAEGKARRALSGEDVIPILREIYLRLKVQTLEDFITKKMKSEAAENKPDGIPVTAVNTEPVSDPDTISIFKSEYAFSQSDSPDLPTISIPCPTKIPPEFSAFSTDAKVQPGEIIYLNLDGRWRPYRVMANTDDTTRLLGMFSIGEIYEKSPRYFGSLSSQFCDGWCQDIMERDQNFEDRLVLSKIGTMAFFVHIPDWSELQQDCNAIAGDLSPSWVNDADLSNIQVYTGCPAMTSVLCGKDGELYEFHYGDVEDTQDYFPYEVHPSLTLRLGGLPYYYNPADRVELENFS